MFAKVHMSIPLSAAGKDFFLKFSNIAGPFKGDASSLFCLQLCMSYSRSNTFQNYIIVIAIVLVAHRSSD